MATLYSSSIYLDHSGTNSGFAPSELRNVARAMKGRNAGRNPGLKGVLIYNNFAAGVRARRFFESLACDWEKSLEEQIWKFDDCSRGPKDTSGIPCLG